MSQQQNVKFKRGWRRKRNNNRNKNTPLEPLNVTLCVTTRSVGFGVVGMLELEGFERIKLPNIYELYRYGLALFELKIKLVHSSAPCHMVYNKNFLSFEEDEPYLFPRWAALPVQLATPLNALGSVTIHDKVYIPVIGKKNYTGDKQFIPQSEQIVLSTLRETVEALSDIKTRQEYRKKFYDNNPIPGCIWRNAPDDPILINPDDIIPINFNNSRTEFRNVHSTIQDLSENKYLFKDLRTEPDGSMALLTCNNQNGMRIIDREEGEDLLQYQSRCCIEGDIDKYGYLEPLTEEVKVVGGVSLLGEKPVIEKLRYPVYLGRHENLYLQHRHGSYMGFYRFLLGSVSRPIPINNSENSCIARRVFPVSLSVTTRSIGFGVVEIIKLCRSKNVDEVNIYDIYRYGLALFESKIKLVHRLATHYNGMSSEDLGAVLTNKSYLPLSLIENPAEKTLMCASIQLPAHLSITLNALGLVRVHNKVYVPQIGKKNYTKERQFIPQSEQILLSTLRDTVIALSDPKTRLEYRQKFYENNPIPGCIWRNAPNDPILTNPNDIIPEDYDYLIRHHMLSHFGKIRKNYFKNLNTKPEGNEAILVCNNQNGMRVNDRKEGEDLFEYQSRCHIEGDVNEIDCLKLFRDEIVEEGVLSLLGEKPAIENLRYPVYLVRHENFCRYVHNSISYTDLTRKIACGVQINMSDSDSSDY